MLNRWRICLLLLLLLSLEGCLSEVKGTEHNSTTFRHFSGSTTQWSKTNEATTKNRIVNVRSRYIVQGERVRAAGIATNVAGPVSIYGGQLSSSAGTVTGHRSLVTSASGGGGSVGGTSLINVPSLRLLPPASFDPQLLGGHRGNPGIKIRVNPRGFQYASALARQILDVEIRRLRIPPIHQQIKEICGQVTICNIFISNYRSPACIEIFPAPPNKIIIRLTDLDIGITGNLDGQANIILPIKLFGIVHANFYHVSAEIGVAVGRSPYGTPYLYVTDCNINIPYADVCIQCGGLVGDLANLLFRREISQRVRSMVPSQICEMLPQVLNDRINPLLARIPQSISFNQIASMFMSLLGPRVPAYCYSAACLPPTTTLPPLPPVPSVTPPSNPPASNFDHTVTAVNSNVPSSAVSSNSETSQQQNVASINNQVDSSSSSLYQENIPSMQFINVDMSSSIENSPSTNTETATELIDNNLDSNGYNKRRNVLSGQPIKKIVPQFTQIVRLRTKRQTQRTVIPLTVISRNARQTVIFGRSPLNNNNNNIREVAISSPLTPRKLNQNPSLLKPHIPVIVYNTTNRTVIRGVILGSGSQVGIRGGGASGLCAGCPPGAANDSFGAIASIITSQLDLRKLADVVLTTQVISAFATNYYYEIDLNGEFSGRGFGGTPFGPFPMFWPTPVGAPMIEILISDYVINSLLYTMNRRNFLTFQIGSQTPGIGPLLTTTCGGGEDYSAEAPTDSGEILLARLIRLQRRRKQHKRLRNKRQATSSTAGGGGGTSDSGAAFGSLSDLADLGICLGDIMPAVQEKYPNRTLSIVVHTARAPSVQLTASGGGGVVVNLMAFADFYLEGTNIRVGTISVTTVANIALRIVGNRISGTASLPVLQLADRDNTLGIGQDALNNLANLAKDMLIRAVNEQLQRGMPLTLPTSNLPINIINPQIRILNHAIYIGSDFTISPSALQTI